jgi:hypothetical protein
LHNVFSAWLAAGAVEVFCKEWRIAHLAIPFQGWRT